MVTFDQFGLKDELVSAVNAIGFTTPTPIQQQAIPLLVKSNSDITALAQTGTGKTAAFGLPLLNRIDTSSPVIQALVLSPTRELCMQIQEEFVKYSKFLKGVNTVAVYGGTPIGAQIRELNRGANVIVATPGRFIDLLDRGVISLEHINTFVLDEADEMLNMGFRDDIDAILKNAPARESIWLFSATMNNDVRRIAKRYMSNPVEVAVARENIGNENIDHQYYVVNAHQRFDALQRLLDFVPDIYGIIFTRTKQDAQDVSEKLMREGYQVSPLHGDMDQKMRSKVMDRFKRRQLQAIVATDVAARGIDVNDITHVINYELPEDPEIYTHRSGRTGRAGKSGICLSLVTNREIGRIRQIERIAKTKFKKNDIPDGNEVIRKKLFHFLDKIQEAPESTEFGDFYKKAISERFENLSKDELINRLLWLQLHQTIESYKDAVDLNAGFEAKGSAQTESGQTRLYINLGTKDGLTTGKLVQFISESTDVEGNLIARVIVRDLSSFFNVPSDVAEFMMQNLSQQKYNNRRIRIEEADKKPGFRDKPSGNFKGGSNASYPKRDSYKGGKYERRDNKEAPKFARARKPLNPE